MPSVGSKKQFCTKGHDTFIYGRVSRGYCRKCANKYSREWAHRNLERRNIYNAPKAKKVRDYILALKSKPCADCKQKFNTWQMDFDHLRDKKFNIASMYHSNSFYSMKTIEAEIAKCEVVCSNCHRNRTYLRTHGDKSE